MASAQRNYRHVLRSHVSIALALTHVFTSHVSTPPEGSLVRPSGLPPQPKPLGRPRSASLSLD
ncbi:hypothetical protein BQ8794_70521 [Mesorhizobium prunaredense]|uniref:Uncharacterized protein n=1 Tax=Mesorhizobium prunaredense TaxID=1631249 RepID=A0A1R3VMD2_9HYPH|nr:hypothetical protein BQ8794_70521 [Mesorhizobium prunaredense]